MKTTNFRKRDSNENVAFLHPELGRWLDRRLARHREWQGRLRWARRAWLARQPRLPWQPWLARQLAGPRFFQREPSPQEWKLLQAQQLPQLSPDARQEVQQGLLPWQVSQPLELLL